jgi:hypothetical protein
VAGPRPPPAPELPLPPYASFPKDLRDEVIDLVEKGKRVKAFATVRKRLGVSFRDAERGVALILGEETE